MNKIYLSRYFAVVFLVCLALIKTYQSTTSGLTRWRGGGFGMYSEIHWQERIVWIGSRDKNLKLNLNAIHSDPAIRELKTQAKRHPSKENLIRLSEEIKKYNNEVSHYVQVWRPKFDSVSAVYTRELIEQYEYKK